MALHRFLGWFLGLIERAVAPRSATEIRALMMSYPTFNATFYSDIKPITDATASMS